MNTRQTTDGSGPIPGAERCSGWVEVVCILGLVFLQAGGPPPDVNEAHYLVKASHYWNPAGLGPDVFLDSADPHLVFYWLFGWISLYMSLTVTAWVGRVIAWTLLAIAWQRLSWSVVPERYASVVAAGLFLVLSDHCHLAGEWVVGGIEAKSLAWPLVLFGWRSMVCGQWRMVWLWLGAAAALHVLVGGWGMVAAGICWCLSGQRRPALMHMAPGIVLGGMLALGGLLPALHMLSGIEPGIAAEANLIYVFGRLPHHLVFQQFAWARLLSFGLLLLIWCGLWWHLKDRTYWSCFNGFALASLLIACGGVISDLATRTRPEMAAWLLRFYWFRLADVALPAAVAIGGVAAIAQWARENIRRARWAWSAAILAPSILIGLRFANLQADFRPRAVQQSQPVGYYGTGFEFERYRAWRDVCRWIDEHTAPHSLFLTPRKQQTFKWYARRAELACWKDIPQDPASIVRWWRLMQEVYPLAVVEGGLGWWSDEQLRQIAQRHAVDYILEDPVRSRPLGFQRVYPAIPSDNRHFALYRVYREESPSEGRARE